MGRCLGEPFELPLVCPLSILIGHIESNSLPKSQSVGINEQFKLTWASQPPRDISTFTHFHQGTHSNNILMVKLGT